MSKSKRRQVALRVLRAMLVASFVLTLLSSTALAWWYYEWRFHANENWRCAGGCGIWVGAEQVWYDRVEHKWHCHDGSGYCYDTGESRSFPKFAGCMYNCNY